MLLALKIVYRLITHITNHSFGIIVSRMRRIGRRSGEVAIRPRSIIGVPCIRGTGMVLMDNYRLAAV